MVAYFASNCPISGPKSVGVSAEVDFNGVQWSPEVGLMFPVQASLETPMRPPRPSAALEAWPSKE